MSTTPLPLSTLCDVVVSVTPAGVAVPAFNQGLIVGNSGRIPSQGANSRCLLFSSLAAMTAQGFQPTDDEYIAALVIGNIAVGSTRWIRPSPEIETVATNVARMAVRSLQDGSSAEKGPVTPSTLLTQIETDLSRLRRALATDL